MSTVLEIKLAIDTLSEEERGELCRLLDADHAIPHPLGGLDLEVDSPELEAELLKAAHQPSAPYSAQEMREMCERLVVELRARK